MPWTLLRAPLPPNDPPPTPDLPSHKNIMLRKHHRIPPLLPDATLSATPRAAHVACLAYTKI